MPPPLTPSLQIPYFMTQRRQLEQADTEDGASHIISSFDNNDPLDDGEAALEAPHDDGPGYAHATQLTLLAPLSPQTANGFAPWWHLGARCFVIFGTTQTATTPGSAKTTWTAKRKCLNVAVRLFHTSACNNPLKGAARLREWI
jgi:hypothetical protein